MDRGRQFGASQKRKRKRESTRKLMNILGEKVEKQQEFSVQLHRTMQGIFSRLTTIQELLVADSPTNSGRNHYHESNIQSPRRIHCRNKRPKHECSDYMAEPLEYSTDEDEISSKWVNNMGEVVDVFHARLQPPVTYAAWGYADGPMAYESSLQSMASQSSNADRSVLSTPTSFAPSIFSENVGGGGGMGSVKSSTHSIHGGDGEEGGGGGGGGGSVNPITTQDSPCDCTAARKFCKCRKHGHRPSGSVGAGGSIAAQPSGSVGLPTTVHLGTSINPQGPTGDVQVMLQPPSPPQQVSQSLSMFSGDAERTPGGSQGSYRQKPRLTESEKSKCTCKGTRIVQRVCPLKAKRRLTTPTEKNVYAPAEAQHFKDKELDTAFDTKSDPDVQLDPNEEVFMHVFPDLDTDMSLPMDWPLPFTPMQDYFDVPKHMFTEPFSYTEEELADAFEEEEVPDVQLQDTECVFMDQFPDLTEPATVPREQASVGEAAPSVASVPQAATGSQLETGMATGASKNSFPSIALSTPSQAGSIAAPTSIGRASSTLSEMTTYEACLGTPLASCHCTPCRGSDRGSQRQGNMSQGSMFKDTSSMCSAKHPMGSAAQRTPSKISANPMSTLAQSSFASHCSCHPCPSIDAAQGVEIPSLNIRPPSKTSNIMKQRSTVSARSGVRSKTPSKQPSASSARSCSRQPSLQQASREICDQEPLAGCTCKPTCAEHKAELYPSGKPSSKQHSLLQASREVCTQEPLDECTCKPTCAERKVELYPSGKPSCRQPSALGIKQEDGTRDYMWSEEPDQWSDKDLEHAFSEDNISMVELSPEEALFQSEFPDCAEIPTSIQMPQPFTPQQDFSTVPEECFTYPHEFSDNQLDAAFIEEKLSHVQLSEEERKFMDEFPGLGGPDEERPKPTIGQSSRIESAGSRKTSCRCHKRVVRPCKCKKKLMELQAAQGKM